MTPPLLLSSDPELHAVLTRLAAAAGVGLDVVTAHEVTGRRWAMAPLVLVGADSALALAARGLPHRRDLVLVGADEEDLTFELAAATAADHVVVMPSAEPWLLQRLARTDPAAVDDGVVVGVVPGRGGAGATTLACALAVTAAREGVPTALLDADPLGGGIDLVLGAEDCPGARWGGGDGVPPLGADDGPPEVDGLLVLSWERSPLGPSLVAPEEAVLDVLAGLRRSRSLVVVDLPRWWDPASSAALDALDVALLITPAEVRATAAAAAVSGRLRERVADLRLVVRGPAPSGLPAELVADALDLPLAGELAPEPGLALALERGEPPARTGRGPLAALCRSLLLTLPRAEDRAA
ncbi:secretion/DNA translocation related CpaE-like protein [Motilibacter rhizosphaerae]|uniref:Secretion/DNA translocation related CpaE-like protein n=1 Tax=Motilibacter rhizosphaerae TaxID=598652 RepID=A0A4Q7NAG0_9ACTN|nr:septum site-determining protein Ssd [Motilibacter rhizosphaerae]RZS79387.1 secretion/DNA translocation related CpaE-like protein [Motilibacter rhizosphaerae]